MGKKYFIVEAMCGHVRRGRCVWIPFTTMADSEKEAAAKVRQFSRVKHHRKDAIRSVKEVSFDEFMKQRAENDADPYLHCKSMHEQKTIVGFEERVVDIRKKRERKPKDNAFRVRLNKIATYEADFEIRSYIKLGECI